MKLRLRHRIQLTLFLLFFFPALLLVSGEKHLNADREHRLQPLEAEQLLAYYAQNIWQQWQRDLNATRLDAPLPHSIKGYWRKQNDAWQGNRRVPQVGLMPCPEAEGRFITLVSTHLVQVYYCRQNAETKQIYQLNLDTLLQQKLASEHFKLAWVFPAEGIAFQPSRGSEKQDITLLASSIKPSLQRHDQGSILQPPLHYFWHPLPIADTRLLLVHNLGNNYLMGGLLVGWLVLSLLLSLLLSRWLTQLIQQRLAFFSRAAALVALGDFSFRLPEQHQDEFIVINQLFNRMLGEMQRQQQQVSEQNLMLQETNDKLKETLATVQLMQGERFEKARVLLQSAEIGLLRHTVQSPLSSLQQGVEQLDSLRQSMAVQLQHPGLNRTELQESQQYLAELVHHLSEQLQQLNQQLTTSHAGPVPDLGEPSDIQLAELLQQVICDYTPRLNAAGHKIYVRCSSQLVLHLYPQVLYQVLSHLLNNALQHAFPAGVAGEILISVKQEAKQLLITFRDTGVGIDDLNQSRLFQPFHSTDQAYQAAGMGLYLARQLVEELLRGQLHYQRSEEKGSTFIIVLPLAVNDQE